MHNLVFTPFPLLTSQRLRLRRLTQDDVQEVYSLRSNEQVNLHLDRQPARTMEDAKTFIDKINSVIDENKGLYWGICLKENPRLIGTICYFDFADNGESAELGYELHPFYQHKGIMHEALLAVITYGFQTMKLKFITAFPTAQNISSIRLLERHGFLLEPDGVMREGNLVRYVKREDSATRGNSE